MASVAYNGQAYVYNITQGINYPASGTDGTNALVLAMRAALDNDILIVYKDHTCTGSAVIRYNNISIKAAPNTNPIVTWIAAHKENMTGSNSFEAMGANPVTNIDTKTCIFINSGKTISFGETNSTGVLTLKGSPTLYGRIIKSYGTINLYDGIIITGGNTGGGTYSDSKTQWNGNPILETNTKPNKGNEITYGQNGFGSGIFISGENIELNMYGGQIIDNYSLWGASTSDTGHNYTGGGGGVFLASGVTMNMYGGSITHNAAGSGGGGGILVGSGAELVISGGTISENISNFASGGGIGVQIQNKGITITGGTIADNKVAGSGGGIFARGDSRSITITGGIFENNIADNGGAILFWTVSDDLEKNKLIIGGNTILRNNHANRGGAIYIGRETAKAGDGTTYALGQIIQLLISDDADIYNNSASENGGAVYI